VRKELDVVIRIQQDFREQDSLGNEPSPYTLHATTA